MSTDLFERYATLDPAIDGTGGLAAADLLVAIDQRRGVMQTHDTLTPSPAIRPRHLKLVVMFAVLATFAVAGTLWAADLGGGESLPAAPTPSVTAPAPLTSEERGALTVLDSYVKAYNSRDIHGMMALFTEESALLNYRNGGADDRYGLDAIRSAFETDFTLSAGDEALTVSDISVTGSTVIFEAKWRTRSLGTWCGSDTETMTIHDGKILTYEGAVLGGVPCD